MQSASLAESRTSLQRCRYRALRKSAKSQSMLTCFALSFNTAGAKKKSWCHKKGLFCRLKVFVLFYSLKFRVLARRTVNSVRCSFAWSSGSRLSVPNFGQVLLAPHPSHTLVFHRPPLMTDLKNSEHTTMFLVVVTQAGHSSS